MNNKIKQIWDSLFGTKSNNNRITPSEINELKPDEIFVFGSNTRGVHGGGAALTALKWGAKMGIGFGLEGQTFALPTKDNYIRTLPLSNIQHYVREFIKVARLNPNYKFMVTLVGCGLAGLTPKQIAPMFKEAVNIENIYLPQEFWDILC